MFLASKNTEKITKILNQKKSNKQKYISFAAFILCSLLLVLIYNGRLKNSLKGYYY